MKKKINILAAVAIAVFAICSGSVLAAEDVEQSEQIMDSQTETKEIGIEPVAQEAIDDTRMENVIDTDASRLASSGINRFAPIYISFKIKNEMEGYQIKSLVYHNQQDPSNEIVLDMVYNAEGNEYTGMKDSDESMLSGAWNLDTIWMIDPNQRVYPISRDKASEAYFEKYTFTLMENAVHRTENTGASETVSTEVIQTEPVTTGLGAPASPNTGDSNQSYGTLVWTTSLSVLALVLGGMLNRRKKTSERF